MWSNMHARADMQPDSGCGLTWSNTHAHAHAQGFAILRSNARARTDMQPAGSTHGNARS